MESLTKKRISKYEAKQLFEESGIGTAESINEINESEFSSVPIPKRKHCFTKRI